MSSAVAHAPRRGIDPIERRALTEIWGKKCAYCEEQSGPFAIDHIVPYSLGGSCDIENLCLCCKRCNYRKSSSSLPQLYEGLILAIAQRKAATIRGRIKWYRLQIETPAEAVFGRPYVTKYLTRKSIGRTERVTALDLSNYEKLIREALDGKRLYAWFASRQEEQVV